MSKRILKGYSLVEEKPIRGKPLAGEEFGEIIDWEHNIVAEGKTKEGLLKYARLKKLDPLWKLTIQNI